MLNPARGGRRHAIQLLLTTRSGAVRARVAATNELKAVIVTAPDALRQQLRMLPYGAQVEACARLRADPAGDIADRTARVTLRAIARRIKQLETEIREHERHLHQLVAEEAPQLVDQPGIGSLTAAQLIISWSHRGRCRSDAAFARLAGVAPIEASSGQTVRHRLNRGGDRQLNRALQLVAITRMRTDPATRDYVARRLNEGKTLREIRRCLKRYIARQTWRLLEHPTTLDAT
jgi:transposase